MKYGRAASLASATTIVLIIRRGRWFSYLGICKDGSLKSVTYPSGRLIEYLDLDRAGRVRKVNGTRPGDPATPYLKAATYNAHGLMESRTFGNNLVERWLYSPKRLLPYRIRLGTSASADSVGRWDFSYCAGAEANVECSNNNGNVMEGSSVTGTQLTHYER